MKSPKLLAHTHRAAHNMLICLQSHSSTHFLPRLDWATKRDGVCVCVCVSRHMHALLWSCEDGVFGSRWMFLRLESPYQPNTHTNKRAHIHNLHSSIHCFLLLIIKCTIYTVCNTHTVFKRIFPFAQQTNSYIFSHLMPPLLVDRWALENCCCLSEWGSLSLSKWFI